MDYKLTKSNIPINNSDMLVKILVGLVALYIVYKYISPMLTGDDLNESFYALPYAMNKDKEDYYPKDSGLLFNNNKCNKSCCNQLWPVPFDTDHDETCNNNGEKYVPSNYMCQGEHGAGCVCVTEKEADYLDSRGLNKSQGPHVIFPYPENNEVNAANSTAGDYAEF
jgi:hypothetical protein